MPVDVAGDVERGELLADFREFRPHLGGFALQQADGLFRQDVSVNVDRLHRLCDHGVRCCSRVEKRRRRGRERNASRRAHRVADGVRIVIGCARSNPGGTGPEMLDQPAASHRARLRDRPRLDFQDHLADLEANGLLVRIDRPINKDTELHPLVRWQFLGGVPEDKRRAFLFTHVTDAKGRRYDIPVVVGAMAASPDIYAIGMGQPVEAIGDAWMRAIANGCAPVVMFTGPQKLAIDMDELGVAGALAGAPIEMAKAVTVDLDVPASSEIVIEGLIDPEKLEPEAPFGESNGYVALEAYNMPMRVTAITHKRKPVFTSIISQVTPSESSVIKKVAYEPLFLSHLRDRLGIKGVRRVAMHERLTNLRPVIFVQLAEGVPRSEVWRALHGAATLQSNCGKIVIAVSEDIDPASMDAVLWSLAYRTNPIEDVHLVPHRGGVQGAQHGPKTSDSGMLVDATRKYPMAPLALPTREYMEHARALWEELDLYPLSVQSPWHGYGLGDWTDRWETFARRAASGDWELTGSETLAAQRGGMTPETPARFEGKVKKP